MQETNMRVNALDNLSVEFKHKTQYTVGRGVLGPEIDGEIADSSFGHDDLALLIVQRRPFLQVPGEFPRAFLTVRP